MKKALIVDDEAKIRNVYRQLLTLELFEVLEAENGEQAGILLIQHTDIDLILLDIHMPVVNGAVLFDLIKLNNPNAKVVITSVYPIEDQRRLIYKADSYHDKAEGIDVLLLKIRNALNENGLNQRR